MNSNADNPFAAHFVPEQSYSAPLAKSPVVVGGIQFLPSQDVEGDSATWELKKYRRVGWCEFSEKGTRMGVSQLACEQAAAVGASVVLFQFTPAKVRSIQTGMNGRIDMSLVHADPPASLSPRGTYVVQAVFLAAQPAP